MSMEKNIAGFLVELANFAYNTKPVKYLCWDKPYELIIEADEI